MLTTPLHLGLHVQCNDVPAYEHEEGDIGKSQQAKAGAKSTCFAAEADVEAESLPPPSLPSLHVTASGKACSLPPMPPSSECQSPPSVDPFFRAISGLDVLKSTMQMTLHESSSSLPAFESPSKALAALAELVEQLGDELLQRLHQSSGNVAKGVICGDGVATESSSLLLPGDRKSVV